MELTQRNANDEDMMYLRAIKTMDPAFRLSPNMVNKLSKIYQEKIRVATPRQRNKVQNEFSDQKEHPSTSYSNNNAIDNQRSDLSRSSSTKNNEMDTEHINEVVNEVEKRLRSHQFSTAGYVNANINWEIHVRSGMSYILSII